MSIDWCFVYRLVSVSAGNLGLCFGVYFGVVDLVLLCMWCIFWCAEGHVRALVCDMPKVVFVPQCAICRRSYSCLGVRYAEGRIRASVRNISKIYLSFLYSTNFN